MVLKHGDQSAWKWWRERDTHVLLHVRAYGDSPVSLAMTHMRWLHGQRGHESTDNTQSVVQCVGGLRAWPIDRCSDKDAGKHESKTPIPCVKTNRQKAEAKTKTTTEQHTTTNAALTTHRQGRTGQDRTGDVNNNLFRLSEQGSSCPGGMRLASHDLICDPILRKCVVRQRCYTVKCVNVHTVDPVFSVCVCR